jgi:hypothetical protein
MQNERVNIRAKLGDKERDAMDHKAGNEMHVAAEPVCRTRAALRLTSECGRCTFSVAQMWTNLAEPAEMLGAHRSGSLMMRRLENLKSRASVRSRASQA